MTTVEQLRDELVATARDGGMRGSKELKKLIASAKAERARLVVEQKKLTAHTLREIKSGIKVKGKVAARLNRVNQEIPKIDKKIQVLLRESLIALNRESVIMQMRHAAMNMRIAASKARVRAAKMRRR